MYRDPMSSAFEMFRMMANAAEAFSKWTGPSEAPKDDSERLMRLYMAYVNSGYRYLARWADISARRYPDFAQAFTTMSSNPERGKAEIGALMDGTRRFLREMAELPIEESKRLQKEIEAIMGAPAKGRASKGPARRRGKAKS